MAVKIRLKRLGKVRAPHYRVVVVDSRKKRDGRVIEEIGQYHPKEEPSIIEVASERAQYWLGVGAQPSETVASLLKVTGDWQKFKGLPGAEGRLKVPEARRDKTEIFNQALKDSDHADRAGKGEAVTKPKKTTGAGVEEAPADIATPEGEKPGTAAQEAEVAEVAEVDAEQSEAKAHDDASKG